MYTTYKLFNKTGKMSDFKTKNLVRYVHGLPQNLVHCVHGYIRYRYRRTKSSFLTEQKRTKKPMYGRKLRFRLFD